VVLDAAASSSGGVFVKAAAGDLRGIPVIGPGVGGVSPGTSPESAIGNVDRAAARRRRAA